MANITAEEFYNTLYSQVSKLESYEAISQIVPGYKLEGFQSADLLKALFFKRYILAYDTGLGKTLMAGAFIKALRNYNKRNKFIMFVTNGSLEQIARNLKKYTGCKITTTTAESKIVDKKLLARDFLTSDIVLLTHECLNNPTVMYIMYQARKHFTGVIVDEAHLVSNIQGAQSAMALFHMLKNFQYVLALTATPITTNVSQLVNLMYQVNRATVPNLRSTEDVIMKSGLEYYRNLISVRTRKDLGITSNYVPHVHMVTPAEHQLGACGTNLFDITKGEGAYPQVNELIKIIKSYPSEKGLVYINRHATREFVVKELEKAGIKYDCINGKTSRKDKVKAQNAFNNNELDVLILSDVTSLDLDCSYVILYEFTVHMRQFVGRGHRGLNPKTLHIHFIFTTHTLEPAFFLKNIWERSLIVKSVLGQDIKYIADAVKQMT